MAEKRKSGVPHRLALVGGWILLGATLLILTGIAADLRAGYQMRSWVETPARILDDHWERAGRRGASRQLHVSYRYGWEGHSYISQQVSLYSRKGIGPDDALHRRLADKLEECRQAKKDLPCFINPSKPSQAILIRQILWNDLAFSLSLALLIGSTGILVMIQSRRELELMRQRRQLEAQYPATPWRHHPAWTGPWIKETTPDDIRSGLTLVMTGAGAFVFSQGFLRSLEPWVAPAGLLLLVGVLLVVWMYRVYFPRQSVGGSGLELLPGPGFLGQVLCGRIKSEPPVSALRGCELTLQCLQTTFRGSGKGRRRQETVLWHASRTACQVESPEGESTIPFIFDLPDQLPPSNLPGDAPESFVTWKLKVQAATGETRRPGIYRATFEIPVFAPPLGTPGVKNL